MAKGHWSQKSLALLKTAVEGRVNLPFSMQFQFVNARDCRIEDMGGFDGKRLFQASLIWDWALRCWILNVRHDPWLRDQSPWIDVSNDDAVMGLNAGKSNCWIKYWFYFLFFFFNFPQCLKLKAKLFSGLYRSLRHPLNSPWSLSFYRGCVKWHKVDDCAVKGFEMLIAARGHLTLPSLQCQLRVLLNSLRFVVVAVALPCRNCTVSVCSLAPSWDLFLLALGEAWESGKSADFSWCLGLHVVLLGARTPFKCCLAQWYLSIWALKAPSEEITFHSGEDEKAELNLHRALCYHIITCFFTPLPHCVFVAYSLRQVCGQLSQAGIVFAVCGAIRPNFARSVTGSIWEWNVLACMKEQDLS